MKRTLARILFALTFTVMFSSTSFAEWTKVDESVDGHTFYVDFERIRKHGGYVYWWSMVDLLKPIESGILSANRYHQGDCDLFRFKVLSYVWHKQPMGGGTGKSNSPKNPEWQYPSPGRINEIILKKVCSR